MMESIASVEATVLDYGYYNGFLSIGSDLKEDIREQYTSGECYLLAQALHSLGLGDLVAITDKETSLSEKTSWTHMAVRTPEGYILDADGLNDPELILQNYGWNLPDGGTITSLGQSDYELLVHHQSDSILAMDDTMEVAKELQLWMSKIPPLMPLNN